MNSALLLENQIFTVTQITDFIKEMLQTAFPKITLEGEISSWRPNSSGHIYFTLKDSTSQISAVMFRSSAYYLKFKPKDGDKVRCTGSISVYNAQGKYQIVVNKMEIAGSGNILQMLEERKRRLAAEGLFEQSRKKPLPFMPCTIGVVTSATGAAVRDILQITKRRNNSINIIILPAIVQGNEAALSICKMIEIANFYKLCDVLIVGRGGGSLEDLLPFSEENVVRAVAQSEIPIISAVGHEIDWALCDYAADKRAATPSAAAELAVPVKSELIYEIETAKKGLFDGIKNKLETKRLMIKAFSPETLQVQFRNIQQPLLARFENAKDGLKKNITDKINGFRNQILQNKTVLENASPQSIFDKGYSMVTDSDGNIIKESSKVNIGQEIFITLAKGKLNANVKEKTIILRERL